MNKQKTDSQSMGNVLSGEFVNSSTLVKNQHRICEHKCSWAVDQTHYKQKRARVKGKKPFIRALVFSSVDMSTSLTRYAFATLKLDILPLRGNSI